MAQDFNVYPYYDDFAGDKNFHKVLFKPGAAVQARELTQLQTILQDQIEKFGNHVFKHGSVVIPGNSNSDLSVCYVKLQDLPTGFDIASIVGKKVTGAVSGLIGLVKAAAPVTLADPATIFVTYYNSGLSGEEVFADGEGLTVEGSAVALTTLATFATGGASLAFVNQGVFYVNGTFVTVLPQTTIIGKYTNEPSCHVLLEIVESIVDSDLDTSLLDPAQGSYNYAAPGADRYKIELRLVTLALDAVIGNNYIELMRYNAGVLEEHSRYPKYNELEKNLARRTYDESGDYVAVGLDVTAREHLRDGLNNGRYAAPAGDADKMVYTVAAGKAYIRGFENEVYSTRELIVNKARGADHLKVSSANLKPSYGQFLYVSDLVMLPDFRQRTQVTLLNASSGGTTIGTASVIAIDYFDSNTTATNAIYKLYVTDVVLTGGNDVSDIGRISFAGGTFKCLQKYDIIRTTNANFVIGEVVTANSRIATVHKFDTSLGHLYIHKHSAANDTPTAGDNITAPSTAAAKVASVEVLSQNTDQNLLVQLPRTSVYSVKNAADAIDLTYKVYYETGALICAGGTVTFSVSGLGLTIDPPEAGNFLICGSSGVWSHTLATVSIDGLSATITGISPATDTIKVVCSATKSNANFKSKSFATITESALVSASTVFLKKADGIRLKNVLSSTEGDVTTKFDFVNGQSDFAYNRASLVLKSGATLPAGTLTVAYDYFDHSATGSGDYFSVDSYAASAFDGYFDSPLLKYTSKNTGETFDLRNTLDFRPRQGEDGTFTGVGASLNAAVQIDSRITTSLQNYVGRTDAVVYDKDGVLRVITGVPSDAPKEPTIPATSIALVMVTVPAYTYNIVDLKLTKQNNRGYTMRDVGAISTRLTKLEDFVLLNATENDTVNYEIIDAATGLSRFKSGYLIDTFDNPDVVSDIENPGFRVAYFSGAIIPQFENIETDLVVTSNTAFTRNNIVTLPYTEVPLARQPVSSQVTNVNPFAVFNWTGIMTIFPSVDTFAEIEVLPLLIDGVPQSVGSSTILVGENVNIRDPNRAAFLPAAGQTPLGAQPTFPGLPLPVVPVQQGAVRRAVVGEVVSESTEQTTDVQQVIDRRGGGGGGGGGCFTHDTLVDMADGSQRHISNIAVGDQVMSHRGVPNTVRFVEQQVMSVDLFSPDAHHSPFATSNHPLYIGGELCVVGGSSTYSWLGGMKTLNPVVIEAVRDLTVYNLWVDGDNTYVVNGYGTHSIVGDGAWMVDMVNAGVLTANDVNSLIARFSRNDTLQLGAYILNNALQDLNSPVIHNAAAALLTSKSSLVSRLVEFAFAALGAFAGRSRPTAEK